MMKIKIVVPHGKNRWLRKEDAEYLQNQRGYKMIGVWPETAMYIDALREKYDCDVFPVASPLVSENREIALIDLGGYDYVHFVDGDNAGTVGQFEQLLSHNLPFVFAAYEMGHNGMYVHGDFVNGKTLPATTVNVGLQSVGWSGMGGCLFEVESLKKMCAPFFGDVKEDMYFCKKLRRNGFDIWVDTNCIFKHNIYNIG